MTPRRITFAILFVAASWFVWTNIPPETPPEAPPADPVEPTESRSQPLIPPPQSPDTEGPLNFTFTSMGGQAISGRLHMGDSPRAPLVVLVHGLKGGMDRWSPALSHWTKDKGITWVQIELRDAVPADGQEQELAPEGRDAWAGHLADVRGALATLRARSDLSPSAIGILAEDLGGSLALLLAAEEKSISCVAWLQPGLQYRKLNIRPSARQLGARPALYVATASDGYARHSARALAELSSGGEARIIDSSDAHGADLLGADPASAESIRKWLTEALNSAPPRR